MIPTAQCLATAFFLLVLSLVASHAATAEDTTTVPQPQPVDLSLSLQQVVDEHKLIGVAGFAASSSCVLAIGSAGTLAISKPQSPIDLYNSPWSSGSLAKSMTASLAAILIKDETVSLQYDTRLVDVFPEYATGTAYESVTLENLLGHRGGFQRDLYELSVLGGVQFGILTSMAEHGMPLIEQRKTLVQFALTWLPPENTPGTTYLYSNLGFSVAAAMIEAVTGTSFQDLLREHLFSPLGLQGCANHLPQYTPLGHATDPIQGLIPVASASYCDCIATRTFGCDCLNEATE